MKVKIAIFASGSGSNAENIAKYFKNSETIEIKLILSNKSDAYVLERAAKLNIPTFVFNRSELLNTTSVLDALKQHHIDFIVLAGFLLKVPEYLISAYPYKIINIHPALLPKYGGKGMYGNKVHQAVVAAKETESGITIHYVNNEYDEGNIIFQAKCDALPDDSYIDIANKVHALEYQYFPEVIKKVLEA